MNKKAFTLLELVFVIVVIAIVASIMGQRMGSSVAREAAVELVDKIRYAQHLAIVDDKYDSTSNWYENRWRIIISGPSYSIYNGTSYAVDPMNRKVVYNEKRLVADQFSGTVTFSGGCSGSDSIFFDHVGRPLTSSSTMYSGLLRDECILTIDADGESETIRITPETGYTFIPKDE